MKCPFELPVRLNKKGHFVCGDYESYRDLTPRLSMSSKHKPYIVQAINSYEKIQVIISRLEKNRNTEKLNSEATKEPSKSFWRGQAEKSSEVIIWIEQALKEEAEKP